MKIHRNKKSKGPSAVRCATTKTTTLGLFHPRLTGDFARPQVPKHTRQRTPKQTVEDRAFARRFDLLGVSKRVALGGRPKGHRAIRQWKARAVAWAAVNQPAA